MTKQVMYFLNNRFDKANDRLFTGIYLLFDQSIIFLGWQYSSNNTQHHAFTGAGIVTLQSGYTNGRSFQALLQKMGVQTITSC